MTRGRVLINAAGVTRDAAQPPVRAPGSIQTTVLGVTVGNLTAAPAMCAVRYRATLEKRADPLSGTEAVFRTDYHVLNAQTMDLGLSMPAIAARVNTIAERLYLRDAKGDYHVLCDASEVGRPVVDAIRFSIIAQVHATGVTIAPTDAADPSILWRTESTVGLRYLISRLQAIVQGARLHVPDDPAMHEMLDRLRGYQVHDAYQPDTVIALALACASEYLPVTYDVSPDDLPDAAY